MTKVVFFASSGFDYASNQLTEGLWLLAQEKQIEFHCTAKVVHHGSKIEDLPIISIGQAEVEAIDADVILFSTGGDMSSIAQPLANAMSNKYEAKKIVFLDGHDSNQYLVDPAKIGLYLKRELRYPEADFLAWPNVRGFTFGVYDFHFDKPQPPFGERDIDVAFVAFGGSSPLRKQCVEVLRDANKKGRLKTYAEAPDTMQPLSIQEYRAIMRRAKIGVSVFGAGLDTLRYWEIPGFGAVLCSLDIQHRLVIRNNFESRRHAVYFDSWHRMLEQCDAIVKDPSWWSTMRRSTDEFLRCHHSTRARAKQMLELCKELF